MELSSVVHTSIFCEGILFLIVFSASQVGQLREASNKAHNAELKLFLEVELGLVMILACALLPLILSCMTSSVALSYVMITSLCLPT
jgi:uncharacterized BrkB/YihY/UPF0761 family membrane protein